MLHMKNVFSLRNVLRAVQVCFVLIITLFKRIFTKFTVQYFHIQTRSWSTQPVHLDEQINKDLENEVYKPKSHPGKTLLKCVGFPEHILDAIKTGVNGKIHLSY